MQGLERLSLQGHGISIQQGGRVGGRARRVNEDRRDGTAIGTAAVDCQQHQNGHCRIHAIGQGDAKDDAQVRGQARNGSHNDTNGQPDRDDEEVLPLH